MHEKVLSIDEVVDADGTVVGQLFLVQREGTTLEEVTELTLAGKHLCRLCEQLTCYLSQLILLNGELWHAVEDIEEGLLVEAFQCLLGGFAKENV